MASEIRYFQPHTLVEVTNVTFQNRYLLRPSAEVNDLFLGVVGRAQELYGMRICSIIAMSTHYHMLLIPEDAEHLADFMEHVNGNTSKELGRHHGWEGKLWHDRYHMIPVSEEEEAQVGRLRYLLAQGVASNLVDRTADWPGVHSVTALVEGTPLVGHWYDRTKEHAARQLRREKDVESEDYAREVRVHLEPLPCWEHLPEPKWRRQVEALITSIDEEGAQRRRLTGKRSLGVKKILNACPTRRPGKVEKSPKPRFHAIRESVLKRLREAYRQVVQAHRDASEKFRNGDRGAEFPEGTFPPALVFVAFNDRLIGTARGQPG